MPIGLRHTRPSASPTAASPGPPSPTAASPLRSHTLPRPPRTPLEIPHTPSRAPRSPLGIPHTPSRAPRTPLEIPRTPSRAPRRPLGIPHTPSRAPRTPLGIPHAPPRRSQPPHVTTRDLVLPRAASPLPTRASIRNRSATPGDMPCAHERRRGMDRIDPRTTRASHARHGGRETRRPRLDTRIRHS